MTRHPDLSIGLVAFALAILSGCHHKTCEFSGKGCGEQVTCALRLRIDAPNATVLHARQAIVEVGGESQTLANVEAGPAIDLGQKATGQSLEARVTNGEYQGRLTVELLVNGEAVASGTCEGPGCEAKLQHRL